MELPQKTRDLHDKILTFMTNESLNKKGKDFHGRLMRELNSGTYYYNEISELALYAYNLDVSMLVSELAILKRSEETFHRDYKGIVNTAQKAKGTVKFLEDFCTKFVDKFCNFEC